MDFKERLAASADRAGSWLCAGLDPVPERFPDGMGEDDVLEWCLGIVDAVADVACAVKPNVAFFEALGMPGQEALHGLCERLPPGLPLVLDGKRNDIGHTAGKYAEAAFEELGADAVTVTPYLGKDTVEPFAAYEDKGVFLLCRTSNPSAPEVQDLRVGRSGKRLWQAIAELAMRDWNQEHHNLGLVAGATYPDELEQIRALCGDGVPLLIPGVGAQGADAAMTMAKGADTDGRFALVNVGRAIMYAEGDDWRQAVRDAARGFAAQLSWSRSSR